MNLSSASGAILCAALASFSNARAATVLFDDFSEPANTPIFGKPADIGDEWYGFGTPPVVDAAGTFDTTGAARNAFADLTTVLGSGQVLTLRFDSLAVASGNFFTNGWAGISLYAGGVESAYVGDTVYGVTWGVDQAGVGGPHLTTVPFKAASVVFSYFYDTGAWSLTVNSTFSDTITGTGLPNQAFDGLRVGNNDGGDIRVDNLSVDISAVPEASSLAILVAGIPALMRRRR